MSRLPLRRLLAVASPSPSFDQQEQQASSETETASYKTTFKYEKNVCALSWWEPIKLLEEGSISDIHLVRRRDHFVKVRYKDKRDVMSLAKKQKPWSKLTTSMSRQSTSNEHGNDNSNDGEVYVLKSIMKDHIGRETVLDEMRREIQTMSMLHHPNICRLIEAYERRRHIYLVMEFCSGGDLSRRVPVEESLAVMICKKILLAVQYMHSKGVAHRDIKLENIMLDGNQEIKLIDFGLATAYLSEEYNNMTDKVGTLYSMAPEVLEGSYDERCDLWSVGVVSYLLLSGEQPFWGPSGQKIPWKDRRKIMIGLIKKCAYTPMTNGRWEIISVLAKEFVSSLLQLNPDNRLSPSEALSSLWISTCENEDRIALDDTTKQELEQLSFLRRRLWNLLSTNLSEEQIEGLQAYVEIQDEEGDCLVSVGRLREVIMEVCYSEHCCGKNDVEEAFAGCTNKDAKINYVDFFIEVLIGKGRNTVEQLARTLDTLDVSGTRKVSVDDLRSSAEELLPSDIAQEVLLQLSMDEDGMINTSDVLSCVAKKFASRHRNSIRRGSDRWEKEQLR